MTISNVHLEMCSLRMSVALEVIGKSVGNTKVILNVGHHGWAMKEMFHFRSPKDSLKWHYFTLFNLLENTRFSF